VQPLRVTSEGWKFKGTTRSKYPAWAFKPELRARILGEYRMYVRRVIGEQEKAIEELLRLRTKEQQPALEESSDRPVVLRIDLREQGTLTDTNHTGTLTNTLEGTIIASESQGFNVPPLGDFDATAD
jgi:hypothetical protein